jgi:hypothetical protein
MLQQLGVTPVKGRFPRATPFPIRWSTTSFLHDCEGFLGQRPAGDLGRLRRANSLDLIPSNFYLRDYVKDQVHQPLIP